MRAHWMIKDLLPSRVPDTVRRNVLERTSLSMPCIRGQTVYVVMKSRQPRHQMMTVMWIAMVILQINVCSFIPEGHMCVLFTNSDSMQVVAIMHMLFIQQATTFKPMALPQLPTGVRVQPVRSRLVVDTPSL